MEATTPEDPYTDSDPDSDSGTETVTEHADQPNTQWQQ